MSDVKPVMDWINSQGRRMLELVTELSSINSGTFNAPGVARVAEIVAGRLAQLGANVETVALGPVEDVDDATGARVDRAIGPAVVARKRPGATRTIFLGIHSDTVYPAGSAFAAVTKKDDRALVGPGVCDAKGGIVVLLTALEALERSPAAGNVGWAVVINPDEEIGSPGSRDLLVTIGGACDAGLVFEPALADGSLVGSRKGSSNFAVIVHGRAAHAGRDPDRGRNAIDAMADFIVELRGATSGGHTINVGYAHGGGPVNVVPDRAVCRFNVRTPSMGRTDEIDGRIERIVEKLNGREGIRVELRRGSSAPPKPLDAGTMRLLDHARACGNRLGLQVARRESGGVSDGNRLAAAGLAVIDSMGVRGGEIHSEREFLEIDSLVERTGLAAMLMMGLASGEWEWPVRRI